MSWPLNSVLHALRTCIILVLGLQNAARAQHNHPCWSAKRSRLPHKELQAVEGDPKPPIYVTKNVENESQELHKSMGIFCLRGVKHGCLEEQNKFHGSIQLQLGTGSHFYVYFAGLNWFAQLHGHPRGSQLHGSLPVNSAASCLSKRKASCWLFKELGVLGHLLPEIPIAVSWSEIESWALAESFILVSWTSLDKWLMCFGCFVGGKRGLPWRNLVFGSLI